ncbi:MAG: serine/threonine-protein kinase, partial [Myxococcota bacterium]
MEPSGAGLADPDTEAVKSSATYRGTSPSVVDWTEGADMAPRPRRVRDTLDGSPMSAGGLFVGAEGWDAAGLRYHLVAPLDRGGMGELFVAEVAGRPNAPGHAVIKRLLPELLDDEDYVEMFRAEAAVMARLDHPNVVRVLGLPTLENAPCLALEFVEGRSVQQLVTRARRIKAPVPGPLATYIAIRMARALHHVHETKGEDGRPLDLVHRDVSPGNVLLGFQGEVKLTDFGIAKSRMSNISTTVGIVKGKARYLAPEQILGQRASPRSDLFSSALVLVEMLTSQPLFERGSIPRTLYAIVHGEREPLDILLPRSAQPLADVLERALATEPEARFPSAATFASALEAVLPELGAAPDADTLGQYLRGLFTGTRGPLTRALDVSREAFPRAGSAPLDPANFSGQHPPVEEALPLLDPVEAEEARSRSAPMDVDEALSVLAWLQREPSLGHPAPHAVEPSTALARPRRGASFLMGLLVGIGLTGCGLAAVELSRNPERAQALRERVTAFRASLFGAEASSPAAAPPEPPQVAVPHRPPPDLPPAETATVTETPTGVMVRLPPLPREAVIGPPAPPPPPPPPPPPEDA